QVTSAIVHGAGNQLLITYRGWTGEYQGRIYNTYRIWGKFYPFVGIEEERSMLNAERLLPEIYPNPARSFLTIRLPQTADRQNLKIFDVSGKLIKVVDKVTSAQVHKQEVRISLKGINPGIYFLQLETEIKKFLIVR
ncbi:MAG: T9SS type A sorting domain-containing protein, partial [candidate division WOR-3 bacterium]|nr:T9SS type A sorting domain-containing protein [candidate division WOR-3 bacterium]